MTRPRRDPDHPRQAAVHALRALQSELAAERLTLTLLAKKDGGCIATGALSLLATEPQVVEHPCGCEVSWSWPTPGFDPRHPGRDANRLVVSDGEARVALYHGRRLGGVLAAVLPARARHPRVPNGRLESLLAALARALAESRPRPGPTTSFVLGPTGIELYEPTTLAWATHERVARLLSEEPPSAPTVRALGAYLVTMTPLASRAGPRTLCVASPCEHFEMAPASALSPRQREVALLAAEGGTIGELALQTGCSPETIKSHLKAIYQALGVTSRLELRKVLERS